MSEMQLNEAKTRFYDQLTQLITEVRDPLKSYLQSSSNASMESSVKTAINLIEKNLEYKFLSMLVSVDLVDAKVLDEYARKKSGGGQYKTAPVDVGTQVLGSMDPVMMNNPPTIG